MDIIRTHTVPLGIPVPLLRDLLARDVPAAAILAPTDSLLAAYRGCRGYAFPWGDIIEMRSAASLVWHFVPVELWEATESIRPAHHTAVALIPHLQPTLAATWDDHLPEELLLVGCHPQSRRLPHVLFGFLLVDLAHEQRIRRWLATTFLPRLLPLALAVCRARVAVLGRPSGRDAAVPSEVT